MRPCRDCLQVHGGYLAGFADDEVIDWLALRMERDLDLARRLVAAIDRESLAGRRAISRRLAAELLDKLTLDDA